jgi:MoxR-like ATPase
MRNAGLLISDRRAVKLQRMIAASALICKRNKAIVSDLWILKHIWDTEEQREIIANIVNAHIAEDVTEDQHPRARSNSAPNAEEIYQDVQNLIQQWGLPGTTVSEKSLIKDRLLHLNNRAEWIGNETQRKYVQEPIDTLWKQIMQET